MEIAAKTMYSKSKTILAHNPHDCGYKKHCQKIKFFSNLAISIILGGHFENMQIR